MKRKKLNYLEMQGKIADIYSQAKIYHLENLQISEKIQQMKKDLPKRTPLYVRSYVDGYSDALRNKLYQESLEFCYIMPNGELASTYKKSERYYEKLGYKVSELTNQECSFYYIGTNKPY